jgi:uncharacterized protein (TIGR02271 family)
MSENPANSRNADQNSGGAVLNWDRIIHKNVRTSDNEGFGKVIAIPNNEDTIIISSQAGNDQYKIPRSFVSGFNGAEVLLGKTANEMVSYRVEGGPAAYAAKPSDVLLEEEQVSGGQRQATDEIRVPLVEEKLNVSKRPETKHATVRKEPITETKTLQVPVTHEEIRIERRPASDTTTAVVGPVQSKTEIKVPLNVEKLEVSKQPYVKEELVLTKERVTEVKTISDTVRSEKVDMSGIKEEERKESMDKEE